MSRLRGQRHVGGFSDLTSTTFILIMWCSNLCQYEGCFDDVADLIRDQTCPNHSPIITCHPVKSWRHAFYRPLLLSAEACGQAAEELAAADRVQDQDGECGEHDGGDHGRYVDTVLALECPQGKGEGPPVGALGEDQGQQEAVPDGQCIV